MAVIKLGNTKSANRLISYCEKKAVEKSGKDCNVDYAKGQFNATRELFGKNNGIQAHHVIQSFVPGEVTMEHAHKIGLELAEKLAGKHECCIYTHTDKEHTHNHIVINSVNYESGKKYQVSKQDLYKIRNQNDELCKSHGLSLPEDYAKAETRYTLAEKSIIEKGGISWKDELRDVIDSEKSSAKNYEELKENLKKKYGVEVADKGKYIVFKHPEKKSVRGNKLGAKYEKEELQHGFEKSTGRESSNGESTKEYRDRGAGDILRTKVRETSFDEVASNLKREIQRAKDRANREIGETREDNISSRGENQKTRNVERGFGREIER